MKLLVTGSRNWTSRIIIQTALECLWRDFPDGLNELHHGACPYGGADTIAEEVWKEMFPSRPVYRHPANWKKFGKAAGPLRNEEMVKLLDPEIDRGIAFWKDASQGTANCINFMRQYGIKYDLRRIS